MAIEVISITTVNCIISIPWILKLKANIFQKSELIYEIKNMLIV